MSSAPTYDLGLLGRSHEKWRRSAALRAFYGHLFADLAAELPAGRVLEIGSGIGHARECLPFVETSDVVPTAFVSRAVSAYAIPADGWAAILAIDVLHHLQQPLAFLASAAAALPPGGRVVLAEPAATGWGRTFYRWFHHESCDASAVGFPYQFPAMPDGSFANMGMATALFRRDLARLGEALGRANLRVRSVRYRDVIAYPATGGFSRRAYLPAPLVRALLAAESRMPQALLRRIGLRMIVVLERT